MAVIPAAGFITILQSLALGILASIISRLAIHWKTKTCIKDTLDVFSCYGLGGIVRMLATGVLAKDVGLIFGKGATFMARLLGLGIVCCYVVVSAFFFWLTNRIGPMRMGHRQEKIGLDLDQHDESMEIALRRIGDCNMRPISIESRVSQLYSFFATGGLE